MSLIADLDVSVYLALCIALCSICTLVIQLFALAQPDLHFYTGVLEVYAQRYQ